MLGFERISAKLVGNDAWISTLLFGISVNLIIWIIYQILNQGNGDIIAINQNVFGKWIGGMFNFIFILYCIVRCNNTTYLYRSSTCLDVSFHFILDYSRGFLGLCYYIVTGGFRVVAGIGFFGIVIPSILIFTFFILCSMQIFKIYFQLHSIHS